MDLIDTLYEYYENPYNDKNKLTLAYIYPEWKAFKALHVAETYISRIETSWKKYYENTEIVNVPITSLTKLKLDAWIHTLIKEHQMTNTEFYNMSIIMRQCLDYAVEKELLEENLFRKVHIDGRRVFRRTPKKPSYTQVFTDEEIKQIYAYAMQDYKEGTAISAHLLFL